MAERAAVGARTRRAYAGDVMAWLGWLADRETDVLAAGRVHADLSGLTPRRPSWYSGPGCREDPARLAAGRNPRRKQGPPPQSFAQNRSAGPLNLELPPR